MARKLRVEYPGAIYHITHRGNGKMRIFSDDHDRERFLLRLSCIYCSCATTAMPAPIIPKAHVRLQHTIDEFVKDTTNQCLIRDALCNGFALQLHEISLG